MCLYESLQEEEKEKEKKKPIPTKVFVAIVKLLQ